MKNTFAILLLFTFANLFAQDCSKCPAGLVTLNGSAYPSGSTYQWTCSDGFTSTLQSPTFTPLADVTCNVVVTSGSCVATDQVIVDVCDCSCDNPCVALDYNSTTDCVTVTNTGTTCNPVATDSKVWKNQITAFAPLVGSTICGCDIKEYVNTTATCEVNSTNFRLRIDGLNNKCPGCTGSNMRIDYTFPVAGNNAVSFPGCAATSDWLTISPAAFTAAGGVANVYVRYTTAFGVVINHYRFSYNGGGLNCANMTVTEIKKGVIYKDITVKRKVTYSNGCPADSCQITLDIPQQPNDPCANFFAYINNVNLGTPCSGAGLAAIVLNSTGTVTYQWKYNGTNISGATTQFLCLVGQPSGTYCVVVSDGTCTDEVCVIVQPPCSLSVNITQSSGILSANLTGCSGSPAYQWAKWNGTVWVNVGTSSTYNTGGISGDYRVTVACTGCTAIGYYTYAAPCTAAVTITTGTTTLTANVSGCSGTSISYTWSRWNGTAWIVVQTATTTSTTNVYTPTIAGLYKVNIVCNGCSDEAQTSWSPPNPCAGFSATITGTFTGLCVGQNYVFNRTITGGTAPYTTTWKINGTTVGTGTSYTYTPTAVGTYTLSVTVVDANNCSYTDSKTLTVIQCCGMALTVTPSTQSVCTNQNATFTALATGGTSPYVYSWVVNGTSQGTGATKVLNYATAGTYNIVVTSTDINGCTATQTATLTVTTCTNCVCTPNLTLTGCTLNGSFVGSGCPNFSWQLQYSATGSGWGTVNAGTANAPFTYTPTLNGFYRLVIVATGCGGAETAAINVSCVPTCCNSAVTLTLTGSCTLSWSNPCSGYTADLEKLVSSVWTYVTQTSPYTAPNGQYRVKLKKAGCPDIVSNVVAVANTAPNVFLADDDCADSNIHCYKRLYYSFQNLASLTNMYFVIDGITYNSTNTTGPKHKIVSVNTFAMWIDVKENTYIEVYLTDDCGNIDVEWYTTSDCNLIYNGIGSITNSCNSTVGIVNTATLCVGQVDWTIDLGCCPTNTSLTIFFDINNLALFPNLNVSVIPILSGKSTPVIGAITTSSAQINFVSSSGASPCTGRQYFKVQIDYCGTIYEYYILVYRNC